MIEHQGPDPLRWKALTVVCAAFFMTVLDVSIVNVALPSIGKSLHFSREDLQWVITAYAITFGGFLLLGGRAADLLGRRRVFMVGVVVFTFASFLCGLAWSEGVLVGARAFQGLGAAIISPAALSLITTIFLGGAVAPLDVRVDDLAPRDRSRVPDRIPRRRVAREGPADAVQHLPHPHGRGRERRGPAARCGRVRQLLPADAVRAAGAALVGA